MNTNEDSKQTKQKGENYIMIKLKKFILEIREIAWLSFFAITGLFLFVILYEKNYAESFNVPYWTFFLYTIITIIVISIFIISVIFEKKFTNEFKNYIYSSFNSRNLRTIEIISHKKTSLSQSIPVLFVDPNCKDFKSPVPKSLYEIEYLKDGKLLKGTLNIEDPQSSEIKHISYYEFPVNHAFFGGHLSGYWVNPKFTK